MRVVWKVFSTKVLFLIFLSVCLFSQEVRINEIMFDPMGSEFYDEFIELYNKGADSVSLRGFSLFIRNSSGGFIDSLVSPDSTYVLPPRNYCLIPDRGYLVEGKSNRYDRLIPDTVLLLTTVDNSFGDSGLKNTEPNEIFLLNKDGDTVSYAITSPDQAPGYSDEKIDSDGPDVLSNWGNSEALDDTPGFRNSVTPSDYDLAIVSVLIDSFLSTFEEGEVTFFVTVRNEGKKHCEGAQILCGLDADKDSLISSNEVFFDTTIA
ncbi:MAG TPA: lamin tail domain-containing protein, partial [Candidatus Marinimicrobia bacterium]|nr:lamin tail domain-containing protein [Candidatus Neomarinimicrobiota bacterium]